MFWIWLTILALFYLHDSLDGRTRLSPSPAGDMAAKQRDSAGFEVLLYRLAATKSGTLSVSDVVIATGMSVSESERALNDLCDGSNVQMTVNQRGSLRYRFNDLIEDV